MRYIQQSIRLHRRLRGTIEVRPKITIRSQKDLSLVYTPGVAAVSRLIAADASAVRDFTIKRNAVAVVTDGSAVLGLGNVGPAAALPVMEGKAILFKQFAGIDAYPICLATQDLEEIIRTVKAIAVGFGGINLEDISAPRCFEIEDRLKAELDVPVMHDDQHGAAIVVLAALLNACRVAKKEIRHARIVIHGAGAAGVAITRLLLYYGIPGQNMLVLDRHGIISRSQVRLSGEKKELARRTNAAGIQGNLQRALKGADIFIGASVADCLRPAWVKDMADRPIVFALANPNPEISWDAAQRTKIHVFGTGRSDYPNQINNALAFPGIFRGVLDAHRRSITDPMKVAAAEAIARLVPRSVLSRRRIMPKIFDRRVVLAVARAVKRAK